MILFTYPEEKNREELLSLCPDNERGETARAMIEGLVVEEDETCDIAVCFCYGTFLVRRFFEEYEFTYPMALENDADIEEALLAVEEYCKRHELPLIYGDLTEQERAILAKRYRLCRTEEFDISEEGEEENLIYRLRVLTPCEILDGVPTISDGTLVLSAFTEEDIPTYATLCRDEEILSVWGVDYREIDPDMTDRDFYEGIVDEFERGIALTMAMRVGGRLVGEVALYAFDGRGGAEFSIRLLRGYRQNGYARRALSLLFSLAKDELMLENIDGLCLKENEPSKRLMASLMTLQEETTTMLRYRCCL